MKSFFVSYNQADRAWAEWIAWQLEAAQYTTVLQAWDFRPGCNFVLEMQRATAETERTIAVLSASYLAAQYTQPEWAAALAADPTGQERRLIPVRVGECAAQGMLAQRVWIDLVGRTPEEATARLLAGISPESPRPLQQPCFPAGQQPQRPCFPSDAETPRDVWLHILHELLQIPEVKQAVVACQVDCDAMCQQINNLMNYKDLHDQLHQLQFNCYEPIVRTVKACTVNDEIRETLAEYALNLREIVEALFEIDGRLAPDARGVEWIQRLAGAHQKLRGAIDTADPEQLRSATSDLRRVLDRQPSRINEWIIQSARELRLSRLIRALAEVCDELSEHDIEASKLEAFLQGLAGLKSPHRRLERDA